MMHKLKETEKAYKEEVAKQKELEEEKDELKKELIQVNGNEVTIQFKVMDKYTMIEIIGIKKSIGKQFTFQIICHKDQNITILENKNDQVEFEKQPINSNVDRVHFNQSFEPTSTFGLHGQLELFDEVN